jgi:hypothetical protein
MAQQLLQLWRFLHRLLKSNTSETLNNPHLSQDWSEMGDEVGNLGGDTRADPARFSGANSSPSKTFPMVKSQLKRIRFTCG